MGTWVGETEHEKATLVYGSACKKPCGVCLRLALWVVTI
jgi:hypothetical protein